MAETSVSSFGRLREGNELLRIKLVSDFVWLIEGRLDDEALDISSSSSGIVASRMGDECPGNVKSSDNVRCLRIPGLTPDGRSILSRSSTGATFSGRTGSTAAVCNGPYNHVTSESFNLYRVSMHPAKVIVIVNAIMLPLSLSSEMNGAEKEVGVGYSFLRRRHHTAENFKRARFVYGNNMEIGL